MGTVLVHRSLIDVHSTAGLHHIWCKEESKKKQFYETNISIGATENTVETDQLNDRDHSGLPTATKVSCMTQMHYFEAQSARCIYIHADCFLMTSYVISTTQQMPVNEHGLMSNLTHTCNKSFLTEDFSGNWLHWYQLPNSQLRDNTRELKTNKLTIVKKMNQKHTKSKPQVKA